MRNIKVCGYVGLQTGNIARKREFVAACFFGFWWKEEMVVTVLSLNPGGDDSEDLRGYRVL